MPLTPTSILQLSQEDAAHQLRRTGFGATASEIQAMVGKTPAQAAQTLLAYPQTLQPSTFNPAEAVININLSEQTRRGVNDVFIFDEIT